MPPGGTSGVTFAAPSPAPARRLMVLARRMVCNEMTGKLLLSDGMLALQLCPITP